MAETVPTPSLKEAVLEIMNRGNDVREWPEDEAEAYREERFEAGRAAADAIRVRKLVDLVRHGIGLVPVEELRAAQAEAKRCHEWYEDAQRDADRMEASRDRDVFTLIGQREEALNRALAAEAVVDAALTVLQKQHDDYFALWAAVSETIRVLTTDPSEALRVDREIQWDIGHSNGWEDVVRNERDGTDTQTSNPHRKASS